MKQSKNIGVNAILNVIKTSLSVLFPLITYPYAIRVLTPVGIGKVTYGNSIINYFLLLAMLGVPTYATREGAKKRNNKQEFQKFSNEVFTINLISTLATYVLLTMAILFVREWHDYSKLMLLQSVSIIFTTLGVDWINSVYEDYFFITIRSIASHVINIMLLFLLVKSADDYYIYALLTVITNGIICFSNWFYVRKYAKLRITRHVNFKRHIKPILILFANTVAINIYVNLDVTMLGWVKGDYYVGLYEVAVKVYTTIKRLLAAVYTVVLPRLANYIGRNDLDGYKKLNTELWKYLVIILIPVSIGLIAVAPEVMLFMGGEELMEATLSLQILSVALIFAIFGGLTSMCMNVTIGREKDALVATISGALVNVVLNMALISKFSHNATAATTLIAEIVVFLVCFIRIPEKTRYLDYGGIVKALLHSLFGCVPIAAVSLITQSIMPYGLTRFLIVFVLSIMLYCSVLFAVKDDVYCAIVSTVKKRLGRADGGNV